MCRCAGIRQHAVSAADARPGYRHELSCRRSRSLIEIRNRQSAIGQIPITL